MSQVQTDNLHPSLRVACRRLSRHLEQILDALGRPRAVVDVQLVDDAEIQALNQQWRGIDAVTDVLSFALEEDADEPQLPAHILPIELLGDIIISLDTAARQTAEMRRFLRDRGESSRYSMWQETCFLATHGLLHLLGYDHQTASDAAEMEALEVRFMASVTTAPLHELDRTDHGQ